MSRPLDILALEPFYGGARRAALEAILRYSRHRWTVLKLPPRRIERRLAASAQWFAEQLSRHWVGQVDLLFTSEAMNLPVLFRLLPVLARKPTVVYFHDNQMPDPGQDGSCDGPLDTVNLTTARAATEIWFNSDYNWRLFHWRASALLKRHAEMAGLDPLPELQAKTLIMPPPVDLAPQRAAVSGGIVPDNRTIFVDTRDADLHVLNAALGMLSRRAVKYELLTVGPVDGLDEDLPRKTISERDEQAQVEAVCRAGLHVSARPNATADIHLIRAMSAGAWPIVPDAGVYPELLPASLHPFCLYESGSGERLANRVMGSWHIEQPKGYQGEVEAIVAKFDAQQSCAIIDDRLEQIASAKA